MLEMTLFVISTEVEKSTIQYNIDDCTPVGMTSLLGRAGVR